MTQRRVSAISRPRVPADDLRRTRRRASVSATNQRSSSAGPVRSGYWSIASRRSSRVPSPRHGSPRPVAQVLREDRPEVGEPDAAPAELLAVAVLGQVRLAAEDLGPLAHRLVERQVLEGVQGVVVDEDGDRPLGRQQVGGVVDGAAEAFLCLWSTIGQVRMGFDPRDRDEPTEGCSCPGRAVVKEEGSNSVVLGRVEFDRWSRETLPFLLRGLTLSFTGPDSLITRSARHAPWKATLILICGLSLASPARADVKPHPIFSDNMVLQQGTDIVVWGKADPGESFGHACASSEYAPKVGVKSIGTQADKDGNWWPRSPRRPLE